LYVVHGTPSMSAKFLIALANRSGRFRGGLQFDDSPEAVTCFAIDRETGERLEATVTMQQANEAGWAGSNANYQKLGTQMLAYRAATFFVRRYCPEVTLGFATVEEAEQIPAQDEAPSGVLAELQARVDAVEPDAEPAPAETYVPEAKVAKLVKGFETVGMDRAYVEERYGPLDAMTDETYAEACKDGAERKREWEEKARKVAEDATSEIFDGADGAEPGGADYD
ncbi:MAG: hypothetical protein AAFQ53_15685, partial [Bacteroidota bacterium]